MTRFRSHLLILSLLLLGSGASARPGFTDPGVVVLRVLSDSTAGASASFGWAISELRDIDGDGVTDLIVGAPSYPTSANAFGKAYVYSGRTGQLIWSWRSLIAGAALGFSVADAGDVDGDGTEDILVGARGGGAVKGRAIVYSGRTGAVLLNILAPAGADMFGFSVAGPGDVDHDGFADIAVGAAGSGTQPGFVFVYSGADGHLLYQLSGDTPGGKFGSGLARAGDVNHDGYPDLVVGARDSGPAARGRVYVLSGKDGSPILPALEPDPATGGDLGWFFVATPGDINGDGVPDIYAGDFSDVAAGGLSGRAYVWSGLDGSLLREFTGAARAGLGPGRGAGDADNDGLPDIVAGSYTSSDGATNAGRADVFSGATGQIIRTIMSTTAGEQFGFDAVGIGDTNGDCAPDLAISAASGNRVYIIAGDTPSLIADLNADRRVNSLDLGQLLAAFGSTVPLGTACDFNHNGVVDSHDLAVLLSAFGTACP